MPRRAALVTLSLLPLAGACALFGVAPGPGDALRYARPRADSLVYEQGDTTTLEVTAGGETFPVAVMSASTWVLRFERREEALWVTAALRRLDARVDNPMAATRRGGVDEVTGPLVFTLGPRGEAAVVASPETRGGARELLGLAAVVHELLPRLPGRPVTPGESWSDTLRYAADEPSGRVEAIAERTYTAVGDTVAEDGRPYVLVRFEGHDARTAEGESAGMAFTQEVEGDVRGHFLWDPRLGALHALERRSDLTGTMSVPLASRPLSVRVRSLSRTTRRDVP